MDQNLQKILDDLYSIDPTLKQYETKLIKILTELMAKKPDVKADAEFAKNLRRQLVAKATILTSQQSSNPFFVRKWNYILSGALVIALALVGAERFYKKPGMTPQSAIQLLSGEVQISKSGSNAFGSLSQLNPAAQATGRGGGGGANSATEVSPAMPANTSGKMAFGIGGGGGSDVAIMPIYRPYKFVYKGGDLPKLSDIQSVYKRVNNQNNQSSAANLLKTYSFGLVNLSKFISPILQNFTLSENREMGYTVNVDLTQSSINISQNWEKWPHPEQNCTNDNCYQQLRVKLSEVPSDEAAIAAANSFIAQYGISLSGYGDPEVSNDWRIAYESSNDKANYYIPEQVNVVYPIVLDGKEVLDEGGNPTGLSISVDVRTKKVVSVYGLLSRTYQQSDYQGETDQAKIIKLAEQGGFRSYLPYAAEGSDKNSLTVELGTPSIELVQIWKNDNFVPQELYVPALVFPVKNQNIGQSGYYLPKNVIIPLAKELLDAEQNGGPVRILNSVPPIKGEAQAAPAAETPVIKPAQ